MANLDRIVNVAISLATTGVQQESFSDLLLLGTHTGPNRVDVITSQADLIDAVAFPGVTTASPLYLAAGVAFSQIPSIRRVFIGRKGTSEGIADALNACWAENQDWYGFSDVTHTEANLLPAAAWAEANTRLFLAVINDTDAAGTATDDAATALKNGSYYRTAWWYSASATDFPEVATASRCFTTLPGGETWALKRLSAVNAHRLTETQAINVFAKNGNTYEPFARTNAMTQNGKVAGGEWIDIIRFRDWLCSDMQAEIVTALVNAEKIPYTDEGIAIIQQAMIRSLDRGVRRGGIAPPAQHPDNPNLVVPSYTVSVPRRVNVSTSDVAARILRDVSFTARLAAAIHAVDVNGRLTYDNIAA